MFDVSFLFSQKARDSHRLDHSHPTIRNPSFRVFFVLTLLSSTIDRRFRVSFVSGCATRPHMVSTVNLRAASNLLASLLVVTRRTWYAQGCLSLSL